MKGLNKLYFLKLEIDEIKEEIKSISEISSMELTGMPFGSGVGNPTENCFFKKQKLIEKLERKLERYIDELNRVEAIIESIHDEEIRLIARMRFIQNKKWEEIGKVVKYDRSVCYRKLNNYLKGKR
jgi:hypothetical protein